MAWVRLSDTHGDDPRVVGLSDRAFRIDVEALLYSARHRTDGLVPAAVLAKFPPAAVRELVAARRWRRVKAGVLIVDWREHLLSRAEDEDLRRKRAEAGRKGGERSQAKRRAKAEARAQASADAFASPSGEATVGASPDPTRPDPDRDQDVVMNDGFLAKWRGPVEWPVTDRRILVASLSKTDATEEEAEEIGRRLLPQVNAGRVRASRGVVAEELIRVREERRDRADREARYVTREAELREARLAEVQAAGYDRVQAGRIVDAIERAGIPVNVALDDRELERFARSIRAVRVGA